MTASVWPRPEPGTRWLLRLPNWLGDAVMVLPALRSLPPGFWIGVAHPRVLPIYEASGLFSELLPARGARAPVDLWGAVRRLSPERVVLFTEAISGTVLARMSGAALRLGRREGVMARALTVALPPASRTRPQWEEFMEISEAAGGTPATTPDFTLPVSSRAAERAESLLGSHGPTPIALAPGAAYGPAKQWPMHRFKALTERLCAAGETVVVLGGPNETSQGAELAAAGALDLTGRTDLEDAMAVLARCKGLVGNDSGALHLGRAAGTTLIGVYGSSSPRWTGPESTEGEALWLGLQCSPCFDRSCRLRGEEALRCLEDISVQMVTNALRRRLVIP